MAVAVYGLCSLYSVFLWRKGFARDDRVSYGLLFLALTLNTAAMVKRGFSLSRCPVNNLFEAIMFVMWTIVAAYLVIGLWRRFRFLGAFASPVLFCLGVFALFPELDHQESEADLLRGVSSLHASLILLAYGAFGLSAVSGVMYLTREHDLKRHRLRAIHSLLPSIQRLEAAVGRLMLAGFGLLTLGLVLGGRTLRTQNTEFSFWDAKILWSVMVWFLYLTLIIAHYRYAQRGRRFAWGAVFTFSFVLLTFWGTNLLSEIHNP